MKKINVLLFLLFVLTDCRKNDKNIYDLAYYKLETQDTNYREDGFKPTKIYLYKFDSLRKYRIYYWVNGNEMSKGFSFDGELDGLWEHFDSLGHLKQNGKYKNGVKVDTHRVYYPNGKLKEMEIYSENKILKLLKY
jgi:antitoxin component YwqK of YwqJK toxin-antitoxin module